MSFLLPKPFPTSAQRPLDQLNSLAALPCRVRAMGSSPEAAAAASVVVVALAVANRVLYKLALVPLKAYPFFLAQLTTFG